MGTEGNNRPGDQSFADHVDNAFKSKLKWNWRVRRLEHGLDHPSRYNKIRGKLHEVRNYIVVGGLSALALSGVLYLVGHESDSGSEPTQPLVQPSAQPFYSGLAQVPHQEDVTEIQHDLSAPNDGVSVYLRGHGINPRNPNTERLIVQPEFVRQAYNEFKDLIQGSPFDTLILPDGNTIGKDIQAEEHTGAPELSRKFDAFSSPDDTINYQWNDLDPIVDQTPGISVKQTFTLTTEGITQTVQMTARLANEHRDLLPLQLTQQQYISSRFDLAEAKELVENMGFNYTLPIEQSGRGLIFNGNNATLLLNLDSGTLTYVTSKTVTTGPDINSWDTVKTPKQEKAVIIFAQERSTGVSISPQDLKSEQVFYTDSQKI